MAVACQGGGSHTAFTAGVLKKLLRDADRYEVVGFSGTSGGAICSLLAWYGLRTEGRERAVELLDSFWEQNKARRPFEAWINSLAEWRGELSKNGVHVPEVSPYDFPFSDWAQSELRRMIQDHVDFDEVSGMEAGSPDLLVSAVDVESGDFEIFKNNDVTADAVLASAAEPSLFKAVEIDGRAFWDGLFSKNPPVGDFTVDNELVDPDEIWIVQINPQERDGVPESLHGIIDRRNELAGNIAMNNEVRFLRRVNTWVENGYLPDRYTHTEIRKIINRRELHWSTKLDRSPEFIDSMMKYGEEEAEEFLERLG